MNFVQVSEKEAYEFSGCYLSPNRCVARVCCKWARHWLTAAP